ncbi:hypothetical protein DXG03_008579 [Asterophora parasitica]|uniref:HSF-type DNA-binding domain-containing protein n=1 Tax=Asterophora parasitica TaxID=117018 RepID=A0A9P7GCA6_9AGAR|nr:hypothetical protein DXG03_008579 [Asterophora parasitica]
MDPTQAPPYSRHQLQQDHAQHLYSQRAHLLPALPPVRYDQPRDDLRAPQGHQLYLPHDVQIKRESTATMYPPITAINTNGKDTTNQPGPSNSRASIDDSMPTTSDFVKKLFKMLEDQSFQHVVSWGPQGDCFVVKDMNEFTKSILPRMFKHSNFASFVRQLNKYDFHKVKNTDEMSQFGEQSWTFRHPDFHADHRESLENIKRKVPAARKNTASASVAPSNSAPASGHRSRRHSHSRHHRSRSPSYPYSHSHSRSPSPSSPYNTHSHHTHSSSSHQIQQHHHQLQDLTSTLSTLTASLASVQSSLAALQQSNAALQSQLRLREARERELNERLARSERNQAGLERAQREVLQSLAGVQRGMALQDGVVRGLVGGWVGLEGGAGADAGGTGSNGNGTGIAGLLGGNEGESLSATSSTSRTPYFEL